MAITEADDKVAAAGEELKEWLVPGEDSGRPHISQRDHTLQRIFRFIRSYWWIPVLGYILIRAYFDPEFLNLLLVIIGTALQFAMVLAFAILQFVAIFWFMSRSKVEVIKPGDVKTVTFDDYKGQDHLLELVQQWISLLSDRRKFQRMGGTFINGLLLYGPPGTGKTLLAKVMAGEASVAFISMEGSGFRGMFWGMDVLRMIWFINKARKLAREYGACIAFIDEIDAVGGSRGNVMGGQTTTGMGSGGMFGGIGSGALTRLLYEMDGVEEKTRTERILGRIFKIFGRPAPARNWHVLFMGSTNRPDVLDPALTRPGRFDRSVEVSKPDRKGRKEVVEYYLGKISSEDTIDVDAIVADTSGYSPAQIMAAITKDAVRLALFDGRDVVSQRDIDLAFQEQAMGLQNPIDDWEPDQRRKTAYHEAGHAVAFHKLLPEEMRIVRATIIRRGSALGYVAPASNFEIYSFPLSRIIKHIMVSMAGDEAVKVLTGEQWSGAAGGPGSDFAHVRNSIWALAAHGYFGPPVKDDPTALYDKEVKDFWRDAEVKTHRLLQENWPAVEAVAEALIEKDDLTGAEVIELITNAMGENGHASPNGDSPADEAMEKSEAEKSETETEPSGASD
ncbi:MAG: AAA family ATPase [Anaerolineales bacterium]|nr:AAA family ATPase [Anaerolineales bacterium]